MPIERNDNSADLIFPEFETNMNKLPIQSVGPLDKFHKKDDALKEKKHEPN